MMKALLTAITAIAIGTGLFRGLAAQGDVFPVDDLRPGMEGVGRTVFEGDRLDEFGVEILGVLRNVIGTRQDLVLARLSGGPLEDTGVIAGMSGSPVYIEGRLLGAVSYSLGQFSTEPIAGITPIGEMRAAAERLPVRLAPPPAALSLPLTPEQLALSLREAFAHIQPFAQSSRDVQAFGHPGVTPMLATQLRPIATPLTLGGFDLSSLDLLAPLMQGAGFVPVTAIPGGQDTADTVERPLRPGDPIGVALMRGDLEFGATGTVTEVVGTRIYAFGHPFYNLGPTQFPMTSAHVLTVLPSLSSSSKLASLGRVIGTIDQDRPTTIAGTLGAGPALIPVTLTLRSAEREAQTFEISMVRDELLTPLLAYLSVFNTLSAHERQAGLSSFVVRGTAAISGQTSLVFNNLFSGDQAPAQTASAVIAPINALMRNAFEDVVLESLTLDIDASEQGRSATLERAFVDTDTPTLGQPVMLTLELRTFRGELVERTLSMELPPHVRGPVSLMVSDGRELSQWELQQFQTEPLDARDLPAMIDALNAVRRNNVVYVRLLGDRPGAVVRGARLPSLPPSVLAVLEGDGRSGSFSSFESSPLREWEIETDFAVIGSRTLSLTVEN